MIGRKKVQTGGVVNLGSADAKIWGRRVYYFLHVASSCEKTIADEEGGGGLDEVGEVGDLGCGWITAGAVCA